MALTKVSYSMIEGDVVSAVSLGADPTGVADSSSAIQAGINAGKTILFTPGTYLISNNIQLKSGTRLIGQTDAKIYRNSNVKIVGPTPTLDVLTATADFLYGSTLITLNAASYNSVSVGDYVWFKDSTSANIDYIQDFVALRNSNVAQLTSADEWVYQVQCAKVIEKLTGNAIRINAAAHVDFPLTTTGAIYKVNGSVVEDVLIDGLTFVNGPGTGGISSENVPINIQYVYGITIQNCKFELNQLTGGIFAQFGKANIVNNEFNGATQLAVFLREAMPESVVSGNAFRNQTTGDASIFVEAHNYNIAIANNTFDGARLYELTNSAQLIACIQIEAKANNITVTGNSGNGYGVGVRFELGAMFNTVQGNSFMNMGVAGIRAEGCSYLTITGNTFYNCGITTAPGTLTGAIGTLTILQTSYCTIQGNIVGADSGYQSPWLVLSGAYNTIGNNILSNVDLFEVSNWNNRIYGNDGDPFFRANDYIGPDVVRTTRDIALADNVATTIAKILTPNQAGSVDAGSFSVSMNLMVLFYNGTFPTASAVASKAQKVFFTAATNADGTSAQSAVATIATSGAAQPGGLTGLTDPVVTINKVDNYTYEIQVTSDASGVFSAGRMVASLEILWNGYKVPPLVE